MECPLCSTLRRTDFSRKVYARKTLRFLLCGTLRALRETDITQKISQVLSSWRKGFLARKKCNKESRSRQVTMPICDNSGNIIFASSSVCCINQGLTSYFRGDWSMQNFSKHVVRYHSCQSVRTEEKTIAWQ